MDNILQYLLILYLLIINAVAFVLMLVDKYKARRRHWRIPDSTLIGVSALGGSIGMLLGMFIARHKIRNLKYTIGIPVILFLQLVIAGAIAVAFG